MSTRFLYVMGSASGTGKTTVCQGLLALFLAQGFRPDQLAYIKPMTQCIEQQTVAQFCDQSQIACEDIGSLVFRNRFSRDFIDGRTKNSAALKADVLAAIESTGRDKAVVIIDAVGGPAVGSVIGVANVDIAASLPCRVVFVGRPGIGAAIDDTVLCVSFMQSHGIDSIGLIYNKIPAAYLADMKKYVTKRIVQLLPDVTLLGFLEEHERLNAVLENTDYKKIADWFNHTVDIDTVMTHD